MVSLSKLRKKPHWSFSRLNKFLNICSLQYAFQYVYKLEPEHTSAQLPFGIAFHRAASWLARKRQHGSYPGLSSVKRMFATCWRAEYHASQNLKLKDGESFDTLLETGNRMIECLYKSWLEDEILDVSLAFKVPLPGIEKPLIGELDCVVRDDKGNPVIIDWKTSARRWPAGKADKDLQATCFSYAYRLLYRGTKPGFRFDVVAKAKSSAYEQYHTFRNQNDFLRLIKLVKVVEEAEKAQIFYPNETSFYCGGCPYKSACQEWTGIVPGRNRQGASRPCRAVA